MAATAKTKKTNNAIGRPSGGSHSQTPSHESARNNPAAVAIEALSSQEREWVALLLQGLQGELDLEAVTSLVYGVPKLARGMSLDEKPTDEVKADQKAFFALLYELLVAAERGPRLPTLFLALGQERVRTLLGGRSSSSQSLGS